jgi:hypothetical protein
MMHFLFERKINYPKEKNSIQLNWIYIVRFLIKEGLVAIHIIYLNKDITKGYVISEQTD